jgi:hypothetical protein
LGPASGFLPYFGQGPLLEAVFADDFVQPFSFEDSLRQIKKTDRRGCHNHWSICFDRFAVRTSMDFFNGN